VEFQFLADRPDAIPVVARWYFDEWGHLSEGDSLERPCERLGDYLNRDAIPFTLLAVAGEDVLGAAQLKHHELADAFPDLEHWLGSVFVAPAHRRMGYATRLIEHLARIAPRYGVRALYLQTQQLDGGLYRRLGWTPCALAKNRGLDVLVMERRLSA